MIRINLLPHRELARLARKRQLGIWFGLTVAAGVLGVVVGQSVMGARLANQEARNAYLDQEIARLDQEIGEIRKIREQTEALTARKRVVETLQTNRTEVVHVFDQLVRLLPEGLYLKSVKQQGSALTLTGIAQSSARVSSLMRSLDASPWFEASTLIEIKATTVGTLRANEFTLNVQLASQREPADDVQGVVP